MRKLDKVELARRELATRIRAEANIVRFRWLNEVLPAFLEEFDHRLASGAPLELEAPSVDALIEEALSQVGGGDTK